MMIGSQSDLKNYVGFRFACRETMVSEKDGVKGIDNAPRCSHPVDILDARARILDLPMSKTGFKLVTMDKPSETAKYQHPDDFENLKNEIEPEIRKLYPNASRIVFDNPNIRTRNNASKDCTRQIETGGIHLDVTQNDALRSKFHEEFPTGAPVDKIMIGMMDTDEDEFRVLLGIWKPINMKTPVGDSPLAVMDASSFTPEDECPTFHHFIAKNVVYHQVLGRIKHNPNHRWYYFPSMTVDEFLLLTHYDKGHNVCVPHGAFYDPNHPPECETRQSVEMKVAIFFPKK